MAESGPEGCLWVQSLAGQRQIPREPGCGWAEPSGNLANGCSEPVLLRRQIFPSALFPLVFGWRCWPENEAGVGGWGG